jgi:hypothetical protein
MLSLQYFRDEDGDNPHREVKKKRHVEHLLSSVLNSHIKIVKKRNTLEFLIRARGVPFCHIEQPNLVRPLLGQIIKSLVSVVPNLIYFTHRFVQFIQSDAYAICWIDGLCVAQRQRHVPDRVRDGTPRTGSVKGDNVTRKRCF